MGSKSVLQKARDKFNKSLVSTIGLRNRLRKMNPWMYKLTSNEKKEFTMDMNQHMVSTALEFVTKMIPHHKGAIMMAKSLVDKKGEIPSDLYKMLQNVVSSQSKEIEEMEKMKKRYNV